QTDYGYFGMNLLFPEMFRKYEQAQPLSIMGRDARFKRDTASSFRAEIEAFEAQLNEDPDNEEITSNLIETLFLFKNRFPLEFEKDEKYKSRLAGLLKSGMEGKSEITGVLSLMNDGKYDDARAALDAYLVGASQSVEVLYLYGKIAFEKDNLDEAEKYFRLAYDKNPDYIAPFFFMAQIRVKRGQFPAARQILEKIVTKYPEHNSSRVLLAEVYFNEKSIDKSLQLTLEAIEKAVAEKNLSEEIKSRKIAARIYGLRNDDQSLFNELTNLIKLDDDDEDTVILLAEHYKKINKYDEGYPLLLNCKTKGCKSEKTIALLLEFALKLNKDNEAAVFLKEALANFPQSSHFYVIKGTAERTEGWLKTAIESFGKAVEIDPANTEAYLLLSAAYADEMQYDKALNVLRNGLEKVPSKIQILMEMGK
ncbi:MAG: tetratricopeptide repeat protein, partial [Deltaproteobacteria bacterium]|nr:tetratricopeptide repeat protein [Deltaproteobacteria bacterium]